MIHGPADITKETTDAIVNAANSSLLGGGGVDGAIHRAGALRFWRNAAKSFARSERLPAGKAVITTGGRLAAKYVIHTVGPIYRGGAPAEAETLASCHRESMRIADEHGTPFAGISCDLDWRVWISGNRGSADGDFRYPRGLASAKHVTKCRFVLFDVSTVRAYQRAAETLHRLHSTPSFKIEKAHS